MAAGAEANAAVAEASTAVDISDTGLLQLPTDQTQVRQDKVAVEDLQQVTPSSRAVHQGHLKPDAPLDHGNLSRPHLQLAELCYQQQCTWDHRRQSERSTESAQVATLARNRLEKVVCPATCDS